MESEEEIDLIFEIDIEKQTDKRIILLQNMLCEKHLELVGKNTKQIARGIYIVTYGDEPMEECSTTRRLFQNALRCAATCTNPDFCIKRIILYKSDRIDQDFEDVFGIKIDDILFYPFVLQVTPTNLFKFVGNINSYSALEESSAFLHLEQPCVNAETILL